MSSLGHETILPRPPHPLDPVEYKSEYDIPEVLVRYGNDGSKGMVVAVRHNSPQYCKNCNKDCDGRVLVPIAKGRVGDMERFCEKCKEPVLVYGIGGIRLIIESHKRALRVQGLALSVKNRRKL